MLSAADPPVAGNSYTPAPEDAGILDSVAAEAAYLENLTVRLIETPTVLGHEQPGQVVMREAFRDLGLDPIDLALDAETLRAHPGSSPFGWDVSNKVNVVATWPAADAGGGRSPILNGHIDVVPADRADLWTSGPFTARREGDWLYGRGAADMKSGLAAIVGAVRGLRRLGLSPLAPVTLQSVVEEESTGNGTLACVLAGYAADAAIVAEPFGSAITTSQVGVLWFQVRVPGRPGHAGDHSSAPNAIESCLRVIASLRALERELNDHPPAPYDEVDHPINLNVGTIRGGDWTSTAPDDCVASFRIALYPGTPVAALRERVEAAVARALDRPGDPTPEVRYEGFGCEGYAIDERAPLVSTLAAAYARAIGSDPDLVPTTATTDARLFGLYANTPAVCFGPYAEGAHGADERVLVPSIVQTAQAMALFIRDWCGLTGSA